MNEKIDFKGSVVLNPVPVVLITSRNKEGKDNVFTVAWTGTVCTKPPMLSISVRPERLSYEYIKETMEFTVNIPSSKLTYATDYCGVKPGRKFDKIKEMNFDMKEGTHISSPYINDCPISIECKVKSIIPLGTHDLIIADVLGSHINKDLIDEKGKIHFEKADLITYCHGEYFKMDTFPLGSFGYSVSKKPINIKNSSDNNKSKDKTKSLKSNNTNTESSYTKDSSKDSFNKSKSSSKNFKKKKSSSHTNSSNPNNSKSNNKNKSKKSFKASSNKKNFK